MRVTAVTTTVLSERKPRLLGFIKALRHAGHEVSIVATADLSTGGGGGADAEVLEQLRVLEVPVTDVPFAPGPAHLARAAVRAAARSASTETALYDHRELAARVAAAVDATQPDVVHVDRVRALSLTANASAPRVLDVTDPRLAAYRLYQRAGIARPWRVTARERLRAWIDQRPATREEVRCTDSLPVLVASAAGRQAMVDAGADPELVWDIPNIVFPGERAEPRLDQEGRPVLGMSGNFAYPPNVLGFEALARNVLPALLRELDARFVVIGGSPHPLVIRRASRIGAEIHADVTNVPASIRELGVTVMLSPQRISAGFPNRVVDAVYRAGVPVVASPETVGGMPPALAELTPAADSPEQWLQMTRALLEPQRRRELVVAMQEQIDLTCGPEAVLSILNEAYERAIHVRRGPGGMA